MWIKRAGKAAMFFFLLSLCAGAMHPSRVGASNAGDASQEGHPYRLEPLVVSASRYDLSRPLTELAARSQEEEAETPPPSAFRLPKALQSEQHSEQTPGIPRQSGGLSNSMPTPFLNFPGLANVHGVTPPDTQGDVGPNHYVQWVNVHFAVWQLDRANHTATMILGPADGNTLFQGFGGPCETTNHGDPITLYDSLADRWLMSQFALPNFPEAPFFQCIAISQSGDPTGAWYRYAYRIPVDKMNDYPKFGVWLDAYYMSVNQFQSGTLNWMGAGVAAFERAAMLKGKPARMIYFDLYGVNENYGGILPADFDGHNPPSTGAPGIYLEWDDGAWLPNEDALRLWEFRVNWNDPSRSSFGLAGNPHQIIPTMDVDPNMCAYARACIPQPETPNKLDALSDRLMYRLQYRNFGTHESLVSNHTVDVDGEDHAGIHWFELRKSGGLWNLYQEGIYAPDGHHRWMGSLAQDGMGNMALGFSLSSSEVYPSVGYTGRLATDALGSLPQGEVILIGGGGSQTGSNRWGDYSMMAVDALDGCTFWYTQEYVAVTGSDTWQTHIGAFRFPNCITDEVGILQGRVTQAVSGEGLSGARVTATKDGQQPIATDAQSDGAFTLYLPAGTYEVKAEAFGYLPETISGVTIPAYGVTEQDFALYLAPTYLISGTVKDGQSGWPVYARLQVSGMPSFAVWSDPLSGAYQIELPQGEDYSLEVAAFVEGYQEKTVPIGAVHTPRTVDIVLDVEPNCTAPGYRMELGDVYAYDFELSGAGFSVSGASSWEWGKPTSGPGVAHSGQRVWATNVDGRYGNYEDGYLTSPILDLSAYAGQSPILSWWQWLSTEAEFDFASLEVSRDAGAHWEVVYGPVSGGVDLSWAFHEIQLESSYATNAFVFRFHLVTDSSTSEFGWYVDDVTVKAGVCQPRDGGLVVGHVYDANTAMPLNGVTISNAFGDTTQTAATPQDEAQEDGIFTIFAPDGVQVITATGSTRYSPAMEVVAITPGSSVERDFYLEAGWLLPSQAEVVVELKWGTTRTLPITVTNQGGKTAWMEWMELSASPNIYGPMETPARVEVLPEQNYLDAQRLDWPSLPPAPPLSAGEVIASWVAEEVVNPWGIALDARNERLWISSPASTWSGTNRIYEFTTNGLFNGRSFVHTMPHQYGPADLAYNWNSGMIWVMNVNTEEQKNCIYELDPASGYTGAFICPGESGFAVSQRGLAYDPVTDTWFAGGWNDGMLYRFDTKGTILASVNLNLPTAGLAFNPTTQHLFVMINANPNPVYVLDVANNYEMIGSFAVAEGFGAYSGAGLEMDCQGNLWGVDQSSDRIYLFRSGETTDVCGEQIPWLDEIPRGAEIAGMEQQVFWLHFDARVDEVNQPGTYRANLRLFSDTPYSYPLIPVEMVVLPPSYGVSIEPDQMGHTVPGWVVTYTLTLTNTSEGLVDTFDIFVGESAWPVELERTIVGPLESGASESFYAWVYPPLGTTPGESNTTSILARSQGDALISDTVVLTTIVDPTEADLSLVKTALPLELRVGELLTYTLTVTNAGPTPVGRVTLVDILPVAVNYLRNDAGCGLDGSVLSCELGGMAVGAVKRVLLWVRPTYVGQLVNHAVVAADGDPYLENNWSIMYNLVHPCLIFLSIIFMP